MGVTNKQIICHLCSEVVTDGNWETIEEIRKETLEILLINIDYDLNKNPVACKRCLGKLEDCFEFKSICFYVDDYIAPSAEDGIMVDIKTVFRKEMGRTNMHLENVLICRLCLSLIEDNVSSYTTDLKTLMKNCLPEVDLNTVIKPLICELCLIKIKKLNDFMEACREVAQRIENIEYEDVTDILCNGEEMTDSVPLEAYNNSVKNGSLKRKRQIRKSASKGKKHFSSEDHVLRRRGLRHTKALGCQECAFKTYRKHILARHMVTHKDKSEVELQCVLSPYKTRYKIGMLDHQLSHKKAEDRLHQREQCTKLKCEKCPYKRNIKSNKKSEMEMYDCENCEYVTRYKGNLSKHMVTHRDSKAERKFKCGKCAYETDIKSYLCRHNLVHKDRSEVEMHKCENCEYECRYKCGMVQHMLKHRDPKSERKFKCYKCTYATDIKGNLRRHDLVHKDKSQVEMHKCEKCDYETRYKNNMMRHMLKHRDPDSKTERKFKCG